MNRYPQKTWREKREQAAEDMQMYAGIRSWRSEQSDTRAAVVLMILGKTTRWWQEAAGTHDQATCKYQVP